MAAASDVPGKLELPAYGRCWTSLSEANHLRGVVFLGVRT